ncbi:PIN domain nuclease [Gordonibacter sp. 28C]|uniref:type II toxin-antitoxin system VapC family toxin n=1 Tax=Gordonibacter sp. 28C TaxID=2078569 RepID=UPI000DF7FAD4|nr:PIN domain-containing protein [Gordonibacter sp. 28C]RDB61939.1 PIN domain nuclease [Gordonibacter sp. 28C]
MRFFVDTNIILDYLDERPGFVDSARKLMILGFLQEFELFMSASQATDLFYLLTNGGRASEAESVKKSMRHARQFVRVCSLTEADVDAALDSTWNDFEDACVYQCALKLKADAIITRNQKDFERSSIKVFDCDELFAYLAEEKGLTYEEIPF